MRLRDRYGFQFIAMLFTAHDWQCRAQSLDAKGNSGERLIGRTNMTSYRGI